MDRTCSRQGSNWLIAVLLSGLVMGVAWAQAPSVPAASTAAAKTTIQGAQERLQSLGYQPGPANGVMGMEAVAALRKFQSDHRLPVTGQLDRKTLDALNARPAEVATKSKTNGEGSPAGSYVLVKADCTVYHTGYEGIVIAPGVSEPSGKVTRLECNGKDVELTLHTMDHGIIYTQAYGPVKVHFGSMVATIGAGDFTSTGGKAVPERAVDIAVQKSEVESFRSGLATAMAQSPSAPATSPAPAVSPAPAAGKPTTPAVETPEQPDKVVLKVGDQQFTKADIDTLIAHLDPRAQNALAVKGKKPLGDWYGTIVLLSQRAHAQHLDERPDFIQKLAFQKQLMEAQAAADEINKNTKVEPEDIQKYYDAHAASYDQITMRQIVVRLKTPAPPSGPGTLPPPAGPGLAPDEAKARAEAIRKEILAGTDIKKIIEDFKAPGDVIIEAEPRMVRRGTMRPDMEKVAFALKDGEISEPIEIPQNLVLVQVTAHAHIDLKTATPDIEKILRPQKIEAAMADAKKSTPVWMDDQYFSAAPAVQQHPSLGVPPAQVQQKP